jgi:antitoxin component of MazEF toxin-antitoxin module
MQIEFKRQLIKTGNSIYVGIPSEIAEMKKLKPKDTVKVYLNDKGEIVIKTR